MKMKLGTYILYGNSLQIFDEALRDTPDQLRIYQFSGRRHLSRILFSRFIVTEGCMISLLVHHP